MATALAELEPATRPELIEWRKQDEAIAKMADEYLPLRVNGTDDKKGLATVHAARMEVRNTRVWGRYWETRPAPPGMIYTLDARMRRAGSIAFRRATDRHRVTLGRDKNRQPVPCWTLVITGPNVREWGFWCPKGFVPWTQFVDRNDPGAVGPGCGEDVNA